MQINTELIKSLRPCEDRFQNWLEHYKTFNGNITEFLALEHITPEDKIWVAVRLMPRDLVETFALDCAFAATDYAADANAAAVARAHAYVADAIVNADAAAKAADYAAIASYAAAVANVYAATYADERERQIEALMYLIETYDPKDWS